MASITANYENSSSPDVRKAHIVREDLDNESSEESLDGEESQEEKRYQNLLTEVKQVFNIKDEGMKGLERNKDGKSESIGLGSESHDYYILMLDPESLIYYRKVIGRDDFIRIESIDDQILKINNQTNRSLLDYS